ncbi:MAG: signal peptidase I [Bacillota bacterium]|nr:signal peptidase I [Bacillota bacterium]
MFSRRGKEIVKETEAVLEVDGTTTLKKNKPVGKVILEYAVTLLICFAAAALLRNYVVTRADVDGTSMYPTLKDKDVVFVEKISTYTEKFNRGSIVIFDSHDARQEIYIKRVIATAGEQIELKGGKVYLNGELLKEDYLPEGVVTEPKSFLKENVSYTVPEGCIFVMGDNRGVSEDSRDIGPINIKDVKGKAFIRVYPIKTLKIL